MESAWFDCFFFVGCAGTKRQRAVLLTFGPCIVFAVLFPRAFLPALKFSGLFREVLFGAVPVAMVFQGRKMAAQAAAAAQDGRAGSCCSARQRKAKEGGAAPLALIPV